MVDAIETAAAQIMPESAPTDRFQARHVLTISIGHAVHDTYSAFLAPLLPLFITNLSLSKTEAGLLSVFMQVPSLLQPFIGHLADRASLRYFVILAPAVTAVMMSLLGIAPGYAMLALFLMVTGTSSAAIHAVGPVMAGNLSGSRLGRGMSFWMVGGELGRTLGPVVIVTAIRVLGLEGTPWLMIGGVLGSIILYAQLRHVSGKPPNPMPALPWRQALRGMGPLYLPLAGIVVVRLFLNVPLTTYLPTFLIEEGADLWIAGVSLTALEAAGVVGALLGGSMSDRLGRRRVLLISMLITPLLMFAFLSAEGWVRFSLLIALGFVTLSITPVIMALVQESFPENRALANGVYMSSSFIFRSGITIILGVLADRFGLNLAFVVGAVIALFGLPLIPLLPKRRA
jgi:MFS transporter, FSR family, fosmidomycin resistance protein